MVGTIIAVGTCSLLVDHVCIPALTADCVTASDWDELDVDFVGLPSLGSLGCDSLPTVAMYEQFKAQVLLRVATAASTALTWGTAGG